MVCVSLSGIRQLQLMLLKVALLVAVEFHVNTEFVKLLEPPEDQENEGDCLAFCPIIQFTLYAFTPLPVAHMQPFTVQLSPTLKYYT